MIGMSVEESELVAASMKIGCIQDMGSWATVGLAARVRSTGKSVEDLTIGELISIMENQRKLHTMVENEIVDFQKNRRDHK